MFEISTCTYFVSSCGRVQLCFHAVQLLFTSASFYRRMTRKWDGNGCCSPVHWGNLGRVVRCFNHLQSLDAVAATTFTQPKISHANPTVTRPKINVCHKWGYTWFTEPAWIRRDTSPLHAKWADLFFFGGWVGCMTCMPFGCWCCYRSK